MSNFTAFFIVPSDVEQKTGGFNRDTLAQFDFLGGFLILAGIGVFTAALNLAGTAQADWRTGYVISLLVLGVFLIGVVRLLAIHLCRPAHATIRLA